MSVKKVLISLGHPAHFQLFKNVIPSLNNKGIKTLIVIRKKDILEDLLKEKKWEYYNILPNERRNGKLNIILSLIQRDLKLLRFCLKEKPDLMIGSTAEITHVGKLLGIPAISVGEDDMDVVPYFYKTVAPFSTCLLFPEVCNMLKWQHKTLKYDSYQELAYLHPTHFTPNKAVVEKYFSVDSPYFILRFSSLAAHHDKGISGISTLMAKKIIDILEPYGNIYITSERKLEEGLEKYRMQINPLEIHHVMAFADIYIGDSQTMAAEAGVLGVPFIRFNDFVGRISYLNELELKYKLGFGIKPENEDELYNRLNELMTLSDRKQIFQDRRLNMLKDKLNTEKLFTWFISNFPLSVTEMKENKSVLNQFYEK